MTEARIAELHRAWNEESLMDEDEYLEWYEDLTEEERQLIQSWDNQYQKGVQKMATDILNMESRRNALADLESQITVDLEGFMDSLDEQCEEITYNTKGEIIHEHNE